jgi:hypothetical protein
LVLSFGTGKGMVSYNAKSSGKWGLVSWIYKDGSVPLLDILTLASQDIVDYNMSSTFYEQGCHDNYLRVQVSMNDYSCSSMRVLSWQEGSKLISKVFEMADREA